MANKNERELKVCALSGTQLQACPVDPVDGPVAGGCRVPHWRSGIGQM